MIENLFLALNISNQFADFIYEKVSLIREKTDAFRWEKKDKYHISVRFYGVVNQNEIGKLKSAIELLDNFPKIVLHFCGFSTFMAKMKPTILFANFNRNDLLENFANGIIQKTYDIGNVQSVPIFKPHLTIARSRKKPETSFMDFYTNFEAESFSETIESMSIYKSIQSADGSVYKELRKYNF